MEKYFENIIAPNMCIFRIRIKGGNVMDEEQLREKYDIRVDKRKFINAHPIGALGYSNLKVELYKGVIATIRVHLSEK